MSKITVPTKCAKWGSEQMRHEELTVYGRYGYGGKCCPFDVYVCEECGYTELFFKERTSRI